MNDRVSRGGVLFNADGTRLAALSRDGIARVWTLDTGAFLIDEGSIEAIARSDDASRLAVVGSDATVRVWELATGAIVGQRSGALAAALSPNGAHLAVGDRTGVLRLWSLSAAQAPLELAHASVVRQVVFSADGARLATVCANVASVWDLRPGSGAGRLLARQAGVVAAAFSPDGMLFATGELTGAARLWDGKGGAPVALPHDDAVHRLVFSPDGARLATVSAQGTARVWSLDSGQILAHVPDAMAVAFSPDGHRLAVSGGRSGALLWDLRILKDPLTLTPALKPKEARLEASRTPGSTLIASFAGLAVEDRSETRAAVTVTAVAASPTRPLAEPEPPQPAPPRPEPARPRREPPRPEPAPPRPEPPPRLAPQPLEPPRPASQPAPPPQPAPQEPPRPASQPAPREPPRPAPQPAPQEPPRPASQPAPREPPRPAPQPAPPPRPIAAPAAAASGPAALADPGMRLGAFMVDALVIVGGMIATVSAGLALEALGVPFTLGVFVTLILFLPLYCAVTEGSPAGQTVGKQVVGARVVDAGTGWHVGYGRALARGFGRYLSLVPGGVGCLWLLRDDRSQTWHDKIAGSVVVRAGPAPPTAEKAEAADWTARARAAAVDAAVIAVAAAAVSLTTGRGGRMWILALLAGGVYGIAAHTLAGGQTLGQRRAGIKVVDARSGSEIGAGQSIVRWAVQALALTLPLLAVLEGLWWLLNRDPQLWHDKVARSLVVKVR